MSEKLKPIESNSNLGSGSDWNSLTGVEFAGANQSTDYEQSEKMRKQYLETIEGFTRDEAKSYYRLAEELSSSGLGFGAESVESLGGKSAEIDERRYATMAEYIDKMFDGSQDQRALDEMREDYFMETKNRAGLLDETVDDIDHRLLQSGDSGFEGVSYGLRNIGRNVPEGELSLAKAYFDYYDDPSDQARRALDGRLKDYVKTFNDDLHGTVDELSKVVATGDDLLGAEYEFRQRLSRGYEDAHKAIMDYYEYKSKDAEPPESQPEAPSESSSSAETSSSALPTDSIV
jgi:hypothetical protein